MPTVQLRPVEIEAIMLGASEAPAEPVTTEQIVAILDETTGTQVDASAASRGDLAGGSQPFGVGAGGAPTVALAAIEIEAIMQAGGAAAPPAGAETSHTVETVRIARGSAAMPPVRDEPAAHARGPRRPRETLRADAIKPPSRKR
jgi:hypothetical protein